MSTDLVDAPTTTSPGYQSPFTPPARPAPAPAAQPAPAAGPLSAYKERVAGRNHLGRVVFFSIFEADIPHHEIEAELAAVGLGTYTPPKPADSDVFRKCASAAQRKRTGTDTDGVYLNVLVRDVSSDDETILKRVVLEEVDGRQRRLSYVEAYDLAFDRVTSRVTKKPLASDLNQAAHDVANEVIAAYNHKRGTVDANALRTMVKRVLDANHSISIRPTGGVFFTPRKHEAVVDKLEQWASKRPGTTSGTFIHSLPLIDDDGDTKQRELVTRSAEADVKRMVDELLDEAKQALDAGAVSSRLLNGMSSRHRAVLAQLDAYTELLEDDLATSKAHLQILDQVMQSLVTTAAKS